MKIAYLVNQYPKVSHSFIRREILAIEACGMPVERFSIRDLAAELVDADDKTERQKTRYLLGNGASGLVKGLLNAAVTRPGKLLAAARLAFKVGRRSDRGLLLHAAYLAEACLLRQWLAQAGVHHLHVHFGTNSTTVAMLCRVLGGPTYSFTVHGPEEFDKPQAIALPEKIRRAAFVAGISSFTKSQLFRWCDYTDWAKIHIVHCGVDQAFLDHPVEPISPEPRFVCIGRLSEQKGHLLLLQAASQLASEGQKFKLIFVGDGPLREQIETVITQQNLENHIEITGWATNAEVRQQLLQAQVMVLPSFAEGLPVVIMESLALARPVLSTYVAGIPELVEPGISGWLVPSGDATALADAMRQAIHTPVEQLAEMGKVGRDRVCQNHDAAIEAKTLIDLFEKYSQMG
ncbi:MAG TPA: glycosyltransferase [Leptolyngbyaceae cyanobacterium M33_DOE_097]|uniref:Colanic acid biosynthesis glycosyltransferase WcaL n=1 Tax=Oscillatoriales cyanobacterium SpSt-418 TaxID=2282169 RepID=A0A7C3KEJ5_9CYAN|nr:glycosyltransferase [Leptolyngbyaceae cyanobacterium M33_DOE_097]